MSGARTRPECEDIAQHRAMLDAVAGAPHHYPNGRFAGRGVVICGGGEVYFPCAWICIGMLRRLGCTLPVELWYRGGAEMNAQMKTLMEQAGVICVDAYEVARLNPMRRLDSWELKPFAIAYSRFEEVLYLDADNVPVQNPEFLFSCAGYLESGAVFWPDRYAGPGSAPQLLRPQAWEICGVPYVVEPEIEAGQLLIDKRKCWLPLLLTLHMNGYSDFYYAHFYGDKDTFRLAWRKARCSFTLVPHPIRNLGNSDAILQHDFEGQALFQHRNGDKWTVKREPKQIPGFAAEDACRELLSTLKDLWRPPVRHLPSEFTSVERIVYDEISALQIFEYQLEGHDSRVLELRPDFTIGEGAALMEVAWLVEADQHNEPVLSIRNENAATCFLRRSQDGDWMGRWLVYDRMRVKLTAGKPR